MLSRIGSSARAASGPNWKGGATVAPIEPQTWDTREEAEAFIRDRDEAEARKLGVESARTPRDVLAVACAQNVNPDGSVTITPDAMRDMLRAARHVERKRRAARTRMGTTSPVTTTAPRRSACARPRERRSSAARSSARSGDSGDGSEPSDPASPAAADLALAALRRLHLDYRAHPESPSAWQAQCPACHSPERVLTITESYHRGPVRFRCRYGCSERDVLAALAPPTEPADPMDLDLLEPLLDMSEAARARIRDLEATCSELLAERDALRQTIANREAVGAC